MRVTWYHAQPLIPRKSLRNEYSWLLDTTAHIQCLRIRGQVRHFFTCLFHSPWCKPSTATTRDCYSLECCYFLGERDIRGDITCSCYYRTLSGSIGYTAKSKMWNEAQHHAEAADEQHLQILHSYFEVIWTQIWISGLPVSLTLDLSAPQTIRILNIIGAFMSETGVGTEIEAGLY